MVQALVLVLGVGVRVAMLHEVVLLPWVLDVNMISKAEVQIVEGEAEVDDTQPVLRVECGSGARWVLMVVVVAPLALGVETENAERKFR